MPPFLSTKWCQTQVWAVAVAGAQRGRAGLGSRPAATGPLRGSLRASDAARAPASPSPAKLQELQELELPPPAAVPAPFSRLLTWRLRPGASLKRERALLILLADGDGWRWGAKQPPFPGSRPLTSACPQSQATPRARLLPPTRPAASRPTVATRLRKRQAGGARAGAHPQRRCPFKRRADARAGAVRRRRAARRRWTATGAAPRRRPPSFAPLHRPSPRRLRASGPPGGSPAALAPRARCQRPRSGLPPDAPRPPPAETETFAPRRASQARKVRPPDLSGGDRASGTLNGPRD